MRIHAILFIFSIFILSLNVSAQTYDSEALINASFNSNGQLVPELATHLDEATTRFQALPHAVRSLFGNQRMAVQVKLNNGRVQPFGIVTEHDRVVEVTNYAPSRPTLRVTTDESTLADIAQSEDVGAALITAVNQGKLTYRGLSNDAAVPTVVADVVVWASKFVDSLSRTFGFS